MAIGYKSNDPHFMVYRTENWVQVTRTVVRIGPGGPQYGNTILNVSTVDLEFIRNDNLLVLMD